MRFYLCCKSKLSESEFWMPSLLISVDGTDDINYAYRWKAEGEAMHPTLIYCVIEKP